MNLKKVVMGWIINYLVSNLTVEKVKEWSEKFRNWLVPNLELWEKELYTNLKTKATDTQTPLDDAAVEAAHQFALQVIGWLKSAK